MGELARPISTLATTSHDSSSNIDGSNSSSNGTAATSTKVKLCGATKAIRLIGVSVCALGKKYNFLKKLKNIFKHYSNLLLSFKRKNVHQQQHFFLDF